MSSNSRDVKIHPQWTEFHMWSAECNFTHLRKTKQILMKITEDAFLYRHNYGACIESRK